MTTRTYDIHFGIYPNVQRRLAVAGHKTRRTEHNLILPPALEVQGVEGWVSGSWKCWGKDDQDTDGDKSLHVVIRTPRLGQPHDGVGRLAPDLIHLQSIWDALITMPGTHGRWLDFAVISGEDWSEQCNIVWFKPYAQMSRLTDEFEVTGEVS